MNIINKKEITKNNIYLIYGKNIYEKKNNKEKIIKIIKKKKPNIYVRKLMFYEKNNNFSNFIKDLLNINIISNDKLIIINLKCNIKKIILIIKKYIKKIIKNKIHILIYIENDKKLNKKIINYKIIKKIIILKCKKNNNNINKNEKNILIEKNKEKFLIYYLLRSIKNKKIKKSINTIHKIKKNNTDIIYIFNILHNYVTKNNYKNNKKYIKIINFFYKNEIKIKTNTQITWNEIELIILLIYKLEK